MNVSLYQHGRDEKWISIDEGPLPDDSICLLMARAEGPEGGKNFLEILNTGLDKETTLGFLDQMGIEPLYWIRIPEPPGMIEEQGGLN